MASQSLLEIAVGKISGFPDGIINLGLSMEINGYIVEKYNNMKGAYTCHRLVVEAQKQNIRLDIVGVHDCCITTDGIFNTGRELDKRNFIINRYKWGAIKDALNVLAQRSYNRIEDYDVFKNKYEQVRFLNSPDFKVPEYVLASALFPYSVLKERFGGPFVAKALENSMGREIFLIENEEQYSHLGIDFPIDKEWLFEEFISSSYGRDLRLFAIRGRAVACMMRKSQGDFRANVALGASVEKVEITPVLQNIARHVCSLTNLDFVGIDLLFGESGYYLCEINVMPGLEGIEAASGQNIAGMIIEMIKNDFAQ